VHEIRIPPANDTSVCLDLARRHQTGGLTGAVQLTATARPVTWESMRRRPQLTSGAFGCLCSSGGEKTEERRNILHRKARVMPITIGRVHWDHQHAGSQRMETIRWLSTIGILMTLALGLLTVPLAAAAPSAHVPRIGILSPFSPATGHATGDNFGQAMVDAFRQGLQALGYHEGQTVRLEYRWAEGHPERLAELAAELVRLPVDVIMTVSMAGVRAAQQVTTTIPIVSGGAGDLVRGGLVASLAQPGGNITGVTDINPELNGKQLELLKAVVPGMARAAFLSDVFADPHTAALHWHEAQAAAHTLALQLHPVEVHEAQNLEGAFTTMTRQGTDALVTALSAFTLHHRRQIVALAAQHRLPAMYQGRAFAEAGGLMSYGTDRLDQGRRAATYVDKILKGAKPGDLPVEQPTQFELVINLKTAQALGLTIPPALLFQATAVLR
jgi:putative ABC transport system substrate-binding protein